MRFGRDASAAAAVFSRLVRVRAFVRVRASLPRPPPPPPACEHRGAVFPTDLLDSFRNRGGPRERGLRQGYDEGYSVQRVYRGTNSGTYFSLPSKLIRASNSTAFRAGEEVREGRRNEMRGRSNGRGRSD